MVGLKAVMNEAHIKENNFNNKAVTENVELLQSSNKFDSIGSLGLSTNKLISTSK